MHRYPESTFARNFKSDSWKRQFLPLAAVLLLASCSSAPRYRPSPPDAAPSEPSRKEIVQYAKSFVGSPYRFGGSTRKGFDCSGLVMTIFQQFDISLPRRSLDQSRVGTPIDRAHLKPADLVFFKTSSRNSVTHVGIYIGGGKFIHASTSARRVRVDELDSRYFKRRFVTAKRLLHI